MKLKILFRIERQCTKDYSYDNGRIKIKKGQMITVPAFALHHMEEYYPDPEKFDPERLIPLKIRVTWVIEANQLYLFHFF
jgi:cytochrome P450